MNLGMRMETRMVLECTACGESMSDHADDCPQGLMEKLVYGCQRGRCPACRKADVYPNRLDFYECSGCRTQFTTGLACGEDVDTLQTRVLDILNVGMVHAKQLREPGTGDIPTLERIRELSIKIDATRAARAAAKKAYDVVYKREMAKAGKKEGDAR